MSDTITVRDHSQPCEHGSLWSHWLKPTQARWWHEPDCYGGRRMVLRPLGGGRWEETGEVSGEDG